MENNNQVHTYAILTLIFGILSIVLLPMGWGAFFGLGCGITAIVIAKKTKKKLTEKDSLLTAGYICGIIGTIISTIAVICIILILIFSVSITDSIADSFENDEIEENGNYIFND